MTAKNDVTGDAIRTKQSSQKYRDNWDAIFGKKSKQKSKEAKKDERNSD